MLVIAASGGALAAPTETVLHSFSGSDGANPQAGLLADSNGNLYGTTSSGGALGKGVVFKLSPGGTETVLHAFTGGSDGANPQAGLIVDTSGNLYGTTFGGGAPLPVCGGFTCGVVFKLSPGGIETVLHAFTGATPPSPYDGANPQAGLYADSSGNLYGTTRIGGSLDCGGFGCGTAFKLSPGGTETVLHAFGGPDNGAFPDAGLIADSSGNLYGTTSAGGANCFKFGNAAPCGTVFKLSPGGTATQLYTFTGFFGSGDGAGPQAGLIADSNGNLYGTASRGGGGAHCFMFNVPGSCGTVFKLSLGGTFTVLYNFTGGSDGGVPIAGLIADDNGYLYGTTAAGGASGNGVVFKLSLGGTETVLYSFTGGSDGGVPRAGLYADSSGNLYGTTSMGGGSGAGVVFKLAGTGFVTPPPPPCVSLGSSCGGSVGGYVIECCAGPGGELTECSRGICTPYRPPQGCNGRPVPSIVCHAQWHCCGEDGWECGFCQ